MTKVEQHRSFEGAPRNGEVIVLYFSNVTEKTHKSCAGYWDGGDPYFPWITLGKGGELSSASDGDQHGPYAWSRLPGAEPQPQG